MSQSRERCPNGQILVTIVPMAFGLIRRSGIKAVQICMTPDEYENYRERKKNPQKWEPTKLDPIGTEHFERD